MTLQDAIHSYKPDSECHAYIFKQIKETFQITSPHLDCLQQNILYTDKYYLLYNTRTIPVITNGKVRVALFSRPMRKT